jgi:hypothetical protein
MKRLARYAKLPRGLANRETDRRKDVLAQDRAGMGRAPCHFGFNFRISVHLLSSMVLLQVKMPRVAVAPFERDTPGTIHMKALALWLSLERMEIEAGDVEIAQRRRLFQRIQPPKRPVLEVRRHSSASTFAKQVVKPLVAEAPYHSKSVTRRVTSVN